MSPPFPHYPLDLETETRTTTIWIVLGDLEPSLEGVVSAERSLRLLEQAAKFMRRHASASTRLGFIFNPNASVTPSSTAPAAASWGAPGWFTRAMLLIGQPAESILNGTNQQPPRKFMNMMAAKNFAIKLIDEALKIVRHEQSEVGSLEDLAVSVSACCVYPL